MSELAIPEDESNIPHDMRPDLSIYGLEELDRGIVEDSYDNRKILRSVPLPWITVWDSNGQPSGNIMAISPEMEANRSATILEDRKALLVDPRNPASDYLSGLDLLLVDEVSALVPSWIIGATQTYRKLEADPELLAKRNIISPPTRCKAIKSNRERCLLWSSGRKNDEGLCRVHLGSLLNRTGSSVERARVRIAQAAGPAVDVIEDLMNNAISEPVRLKAAETLLDRAGVRGGIEIDQTVTIDVRPAAAILQERLARLALGAARPEEPEIVDAEVVDDGTGSGS